ncbi:hypothetical protein HDU89_007711 [Geranomyces variabilis]|nr:hypothetical protein HDU89_007711 [Geranomyces variabilis]
MPEIAHIGRALQDLAQEDKVVVPWFWQRQTLRACIPAVLIVSIATALAADASSANKVEADTKLLCTRIIADAVHFLAQDLKYHMEYAHVFKEDSKTCSRFSDLTLTAQGGRAGQFCMPFFVSEFACAQQDVHKDHLVCTAEAVGEARRIVAFLDKSEVAQVRTHFALEAGKRIAFKVLQPVHRLGGIIWIVEDGPVFNLNDSEPLKMRVLAALRMVSYLRHILFVDARALLDVSSKMSAFANAETSELLPVIPEEPPHLRAEKSALTPAAKRVPFAPLATAWADSTPSKSPQ